MRGKWQQEPKPGSLRACRFALGSLVSSQADLLLIVCLFVIHAEVLPEIRHLCANKNTPGQGQLGSTQEEKLGIGAKNSLRSCPKIY